MSKIKQLGHGLACFVDGDQLAIVRDDFIDLQQSPAYFVPCTRELSNGYITQANAPVESRLSVIADELWLIDVPLLDLCGEDEWAAIVESQRLGVLPLAGGKWVVSARFGAFNPDDASEHLIVAALRGAIRKSEIGVDSAETNDGSPPSII